MHTLANRLRYARELAGLSQSALARAVGLRPQAIQSIEAGKVMQPRQMSALAAALQVNLGWLATGEGVMAAFGIGEGEVSYNAGAQVSSEALALARAWMALPKGQRQALQTAIRALAKAGKPER